MEINDLISIGVIRKTNGNNEQLIVIPVHNYIHLYKKLKNIFIVLPDETVLYKKIIKHKIENNKLVKLKIDNTNIKEIKLIKAKICSIYEDINKYTADKTQYYDLENYRVYQKNKKLIGKIKYVFPTPAYDILVIENKSKEILIPFHEKFIVKIDEKNKTIIVNLIKGLLDAN